VNNPGLGRAVPQHGSGGPSARIRWGAFFSAILH
jgi:hypothetical protein